MAVTLGSNISSLRALRSLDRTSTTLRSVYERLSSGARINRAADDSAGLAVSMSLSTRARVLGRSDRNVQDGLSAVAIADSALGEVSNTLSRMAELAAQSANGSLGRLQRMSLHQEYRSLGDEIRRISETTTFNGINLLSGVARNDPGIELAQADTAGNNTPTAVSADGRYALVTTDNGVNVFTVSVYDRQTNSSTQILSAAAPYTASMDAQGNVLYADGQNLFRFDITTRAATKLTNSTIATTYDGLKVSADGSRLAFLSTTQFVDGAALSATVSSSGSKRLYAVDLSSSAQTVRRVAQATFPILSDSTFRLSSDGSKIFFVSSSNLSGSNADGNYELFGADLSGAAISLSQVTNTTGAGSISLSGAVFQAMNDGRVLFIDNRNYSGQNPGSNSQIFIGSLSGAPVKQFGNFTSTSYGGFSLSADESSLSFFSQSNFVGSNPNSQYQAFRIDLANGITTQLTNFVDTANVTPADGVFSGDGRILYGTVFGSNTSNTGYRLIDISAASSLIDISTGNGRLGGIGVSFGALRSALEGISGYTLTSAASSRGALDSITASIQNIASARGLLGAGGARLEAAGRVITAQVQESQAANARIVDADIAGESARLVQAQILQQAGAAVLAQANQQPSLALALLRI